MRVSFVVRLVPGLPLGQFVGEVVEVAGGEQSLILDAHELMTFITRFLSPTESGPASASDPAVQPPAASGPVQENVQ